MLSTLRTAGLRQAAFRARVAPVAATRGLSIWNNIPQGPPVSPIFCLSDDDRRSNNFALKLLPRYGCIANRLNCRM
jgi:hypothetical protein